MDCRTSRGRGPRGQGAREEAPRAEGGGAAAEGRPPGGQGGEEPREEAPREEAPTEQLQDLAAAEQAFNLECNAFAAGNPGELKKLIEYMAEKGEARFGLPWGQRRPVALLGPMMASASLVSCIYYDQYQSSRPLGELG